MQHLYVRMHLFILGLFLVETRCIASLRAAVRKIFREFFRKSPFVFGLAFCPPFSRGEIKELY